MSPPGRRRHGHLGVRGCQRKCNALPKGRGWQLASILARLGIVTHRSIFPSPLLLALGLLAGSSGPAPAQRIPVQPALDGYAVLGVDSVSLARGVQVRPGAVGAAAGSVRLAATANVSGSVVADSVRVGRKVDVGRLFCGLVFGPGFSPAGGSAIPGCLQMTAPVIDPALLAPVAVVPGSADLRLRQGAGSQPIAAGAYGAVIVGRGSELPLAGGVYQVRSIRLAPNSRLVCRDDCRIGVLEDVRLGRRAELGAARGPDADGVRIDVAGTDLALRAGANATIAATIFAPAGAVVLGRGGEYRGAYIGRSVVVRPRARVTEDSVFSPPPRG